MIYAGVKGYLDGIDTEKVTDFEQKFLTYLRTKHQTLLDTIRNDQKLSEDSEKMLGEVIGQFRDQYV